MPRRAFVGVLFIVPAVLLLGCGARKAKTPTPTEPKPVSAPSPQPVPAQPTSQQAGPKSVALSLLEALPEIHRFELADMAAVMSDEDLRLALGFNKEEWDASDLGQNLAVAGVTWENIRLARALVEVKLRPFGLEAAWVMTFPEDITQRLRNKVDLAKFRVKRVAGTEVLMPLTPQANPWGGYYAFVKDKVIVGNTAAEKIVKALGGEHAATRPPAQSELERVLGRLPDGFTTEVAAGSHPGFVADSTSWGVSTAKRDSEYAEVTFVASFASAAEATSAKDGIAKDASGLRMTTGEDAEVIASTTTGTMLVVRLHQPLKSVGF